MISYYIIFLGIILYYIPEHICQPQTTWLAQSHRMNIGNCPKNHDFASWNIWMDEHQVVYAILMFTRMLELVESSVCLRAWFQEILSTFIVYFWFWDHSFHKCPDPRLCGGSPAPIDVRYALKCISRTEVDELGRALQGNVLGTTNEIAMDSQIVCFFRWYALIIWHSRGRWLNCIHDLPILNIFTHC